MKGLYRFEWDCGRNGDLDGLFIAEDTEVAEVIGKEVYFGEVLGKHSDVHGEISEEDITLLTADQTFITTLAGLIGHDTISGHNPLSYYSDQLWDAMEEDDTDE